MSSPIPDPGAVPDEPLFTDVPGDDAQPDDPREEEPEPSDGTPLGVPDAPDPDDLPFPGGGNPS
ncbi:hypothetical protein [Cellulomonas shaoxiangyii]|uniref:hypothetical protein n=1 Tax=Cellulomonas shaoxiangyii TaxID=2566013 RepID=UPI001409B37F|nr:hypothetical protein [Cellulomonas shaoxiangyii]